MPSAVEAKSSWNQTQHVFFQMLAPPVKDSQLTSSRECQNKSVCFHYLQLSRAFLIIGVRDVTQLKTIIFQSRENYTPSYRFLPPKASGIELRSSLCTSLLRARSSLQRGFSFFYSREEDYDSFEKTILTAETKHFTSISYKGVFRFPLGKEQCPGGGE